MCHVVPSLCVDTGLHQKKKQQSNISVYSVVLFFPSLPKTNTITHSPCTGQRDAVSSHIFGHATWSPTRLWSPNHKCRFALNWGFWTRQWWNAAMCLYSSSVVKYNVDVLYLIISVFCHFILPPHCLGQILYFFLHYTYLITSYLFKFCRLNAAFSISLLKHLIPITEYWIR